MAFLVNENYRGARMGKRKEYEDVIGLEEAADLLNIHRHTLRRAHQAGKVPGLKLGRVYAFSRSKLMELIRNGGGPKEPGPGEAGGRMTPKLRRGRWVVDVHFRNPDGTTRRVQKVSPVQTEKAARVYEQQVLAALVQGKYRAEKTDCPTVETFQKTFLEYAENNQKASTLKSKKDALRKHLLPMFGSKRLDAIGHREVEQLKDRLLKLELEPKTVNNVVGVLSSMLRLGKKQGHLEKMPPIDWLAVTKVEEPASRRPNFGGSTRPWSRSAG